MALPAAQLGAQPADVDVDGARAAGVAVAPDAREQLLAREDLPRALGQELEQLELLARQLERAAAEVRLDRAASMTRSPILMRPAAREATKRQSSWRMRA